MTLEEHKLTPEKVRTSLADLIASGRATCRIEELQGVIEAGRCTLFEAAAQGQLPVMRVGRRILVKLPQLYRDLGIPLPEGWQPSGSLANGVQEPQTASLGERRITPGPKVDAP